MISAKKSLGQNFLIDKNVIKKIINLTEIEKKNVVEIGPGRGELTDEILKKKPKSLIIIEKDGNLFKELQKKYSKNKIIVIYNSDILKFNLEKIINDESVIFGNLPYNISSQILIKILKFKKWLNFTDLIFMFKKELGDKILGKFSSTNYGRLSIISNYRLKSLNKFLVSLIVLFLNQKVNSLVIHFQPKKEKLFKLKKLESLEKVTNILFSNKRKMINKNLKKILNTDDIKKIGELRLNLRPSEITPETYYKIAKIYEDK